MPATPTYSTLPHAPATARTQLATTRRYSRYAETTTSPVSVGGSATHYVRGGMTVVARTEAKGEYGRQGARWGYVARCVPPIFPSPAATARTSFRHTPTCPWPRPTATVWRNLQQTPQSIRFLQPITHYSLHITHWTYTFSAKEKDVETGLSYFGSRYYSSDLSIWLSVDPMSDKYASLSPYVYCADNPVKLVDPNGEKVLPTSAFQNSAFNKVYQNLSQTNNTYKQIISGYQDDTHDFILDFSTEYGTVAGTNQMSYRKKGNLITHTTANSKYYRPVGGDQCEIAMAKTLLHEAIHAKDGLTQRKTPSHNGFDQASVLEGLIEYNSTYKLGYTNEELEILSWSGMQESEGYKEFIEHRAKMNGRTFDEEDNYVKVGITTLTYGGRLDE